MSKRENKPGKRGPKFKKLEELLLKTSIQICPKLKNWVTLNVPGRSFSKKINNALSQYKQMVEKRD